MISKSLNKYIWLLDQFIRHSFLTFDEVSKHYLEDKMSDKELPLRTFHQYRKAVEELFGIRIICDVKNGYCYHIEDTKILNNDKTRKWLLNTFTLENKLNIGYNMVGRVLFENIHHGTEHVETVLDAMNENKELQIDYQTYDGKSRATYHLQPYCMKIYNRRWYVLCFSKEHNALRHFALDRILEIEKTTISFVVPSDFNAEKYYSNVVGIYVNDELESQKVRLRIYGNQVEYVRSAPLHKSQEEVVTKYNEYSEFTLRVCLTPELSSQILSMGEKVTVLEPQELKEDIKNRITECLTKYM